MHHNKSIIIIIIIIIIMLFLLIIMLFLLIIMLFISPSWPCANLTSGSCSPLHPIHGRPLVTFDNSGAAVCCQPGETMGAMSTTKFQLHSLMQFLYPLNDTSILF